MRQPALSVKAGQPHTRVLAASEDNGLAALATSPGLALHAA
jgi:hypothetical protein